MEVRNLIFQPPEETPFDTLKTELVKRTVISEQRRLQQFFSAEELGDRKPSQLLRVQPLMLSMDYLILGLEPHNALSHFASSGLGHSTVDTLLLTMPKMQGTSSHSSVHRTNECGTSSHSLAQTSYVTLLPLSH